MAEKVLFCKQEFMSLEHKKLWYGITTEEAPAGADLVPCLPLSTILQMFGVTHIDFFSLDVVGGCPVAFLMSAVQCTLLLSTPLVPIKCMLIARCAHGKAAFVWEQGEVQS